MTLSRNAAAIRRRRCHGDGELSNASASPYHEHTPQHRDVVRDAVSARIETRRETGTDDLDARRRRR